MDNTNSQQIPVSVSVIIPAYNAEQSLDYCIGSVCAQTFSDWELIIVNDGSTDGTAERAQAWQQQDARIRVIDQENKGRSAARNAGIEQARGEWILFLDADDYYLPHAFSQLLAKADKTDAVWGSFACVDGLTCFTRNVYIPANEAVKSVLDLSQIQQWVQGCQAGMIFRTVWGKLFRRRIVKDKNIRFIEGLRFGEDAIFNIDYLDHITSVRLIPSIIYYYVISDTSTTHTFLPSDCDYLLAYVDAIYWLKTKIRMYVPNRLWDVFVAGEANSLLDRCLKYSSDSAPHINKYFRKVFTDQRIVVALNSLSLKSTISRFYRPFKLYLLKHRHLTAFIRLRRIHLYLKLLGKGHTKR